MTSRSVSRWMTTGTFDKPRESALNHFRFPYGRYHGATPGALGDRIFFGLLGIDCVLHERGIRLPREHMRIGKKLETRRKK